MPPSCRTNDLEHDGSRDANFIFPEVDILPLETEELAHSQARSEGHEHKRALPDAENSNESLNFACTKYHRSCSSLCTLSYELNRVAITDLVSDSVIEDDAHDVPDFGAA
jgi:hypothetical protein